MQKTSVMPATVNKSRPGYRKTKLGWIPEDWRTIKLGELCSHIFDGTHQTPEYVDSGISFLSVENVVAKDFVNTKYITQEAHELTRKERRVKRGDILLTRIGSLGAVHLVEWSHEVSIYVSLAGLRPNASTVGHFLACYMEAEVFQRELLRRSLLLAVPQKINLGDISEIDIVLPPLPEQRRIAAILGTWDRAIATVQQLLATQQKRKRGLMQELLSGKRRFEGFEGEWRTVRLGDLGETYTGLTGKTATDFGEGAPYIPYLNIFNNSRIDPRQVDRVRVGTNDRQNRVRRGDIFFTVSSETPDEVGMAAVLLDEVEEMYLNSFCFGFRLNTFDQLLPEFARYYLRGTTFRRALNKLAQGATRYNLSKGQLVNLHLHLPGIKEQQAIADCLESIDREIDALNRYTARLAAQKRGLMQQLLTGRVRVTTEA